MANDVNNLNVFSIGIIYSVGKIFGVTACISQGSHFFRRILQEKQREREYLKEEYSSLNIISRLELHKFLMEF